MRWTYQIEIFFFTAPIFRSKKGGGKIDLSGIPSFSLVGAKRIFKFSIEKESEIREAVHGEIVCSNVQAFCTICTVCIQCLDGVCVYFVHQDVNEKRATCSAERSGLSVPSAKNAV